MSLTPGTRLGVYEVTAQIGEGGMGQVYRATDTKLKRQVAIKILPAALAADADRSTRFQREAEVLASLNHPHIAAIYGLEESGGVFALVMELVEGEDLSQRIARGAIPLDEALPIAKQIAMALEAAHEQGIIHRDLKPANIKVRPDGTVKVLDFGLAKAMEPTGVASPRLSESPTITAPAMTQAGMILGTAAYMSPEQARGKAMDKRTDIWAFGCILYEMLTGRVPFAGETVSDTIGKILECELDWSALPATTPAPIRRLLLRCLAKDPKHRLRDIGDARIEIDAIDEVLPGSVVFVPPGPAKNRRTWMPWIAFAALAVGVGVWAALRPASTQEGPLANAQFTRFTDWEGTEGGAEISPDGKFVAFVADKDGQFDIWVSQVGTGEFRNLTKDIPALQPTFSTFRKIGFSGDGAEIWFSPEAGPSMAQMIMPLMGGTARAFLDMGATAPSWSPDGSRLTYFKNEDGDPLFVADRTGENARQVLVEKGAHNRKPM